MVHKDLEQKDIELGMTAKENLFPYASIVLDQDVDGRVLIVEFIQGLMPNRQIAQIFGLSCHDVPKENYDLTF
jgi:hypothetical protein